MIQQGFLVKAGGQSLLVIATRVQNEDLTRKIVENLTGEIVGIRGVENHWELAVRFAKGCGWTDAEIAAERPPARDPRPDRQPYWVDHVGANRGACRECSMNSNKALTIVLCFLIPPLAVFLHDGNKITSNFWMNLVLALLTGIGGIIHGLYVVLK